MIKVCPICGDEFEVRNNNQKYCSGDCRKEAQRQMNHKAYLTGTNSRQRKLKTCNEDCFNCQFDDCIL